ncbi:hypothetical protein [Amycolatopsis sp. NPDC051128]|uniref:hypothetical protein n=1 Tax=Amycolatopsis sp. NPDC051128 TaxID=3155412 RepID=UPI003445FF47
MKLRKITADCEDLKCPAAYVSDRGTFVFQGPVVSSADGLDLGEGEQAVELPFGVLRQALPELSEGC